MSENEENSETITIVEEKEETEEEQKIANIMKIHELIEELDKMKQKGGPDIRVCPKCFSLRIKEVDIMGDMGIFTSYPVCICQDCGWRSNKWIYLDRTMSEEERNSFFDDVISKEKVIKEKKIQ